MLMDKYHYGYVSLAGRMQLPPNVVAWNLKKKSTFLWKLKF